MKRLLRYGVGIGVGAVVGIAIAKRLGPPVLGDKPRRQSAPGSSLLGSVPARVGKLGEMVKRAVDEGRRVMKQTEEELAKQVAATGDELP